MPPWLTDSLIVALITACASIWAGRMSMRGQVQTASMQAAVHERELMVAPYEALAVRVEQLETEASDQRVEAERLRGQVIDLRIEVANLRADKEQLARSASTRDLQWQAGWDDLRDRWDIWRTHDEPPDYPTPRRSVSQ